jgi:hypothetical protein
MAASTYPLHGSKGAVTVAGTVVANITGWSVDESVEIAKAKFCRGTDTVKYSDGIKDISISIEALLNADDASQSALISGAEVVLELQPDNNGSGADEWQCSATVQSRRFGISVDGFATASFVCEVNGALTKGTVS